MNLGVQNMQDQCSNQEEALHSLNPLHRIGGLIRTAREEKDLSIEDLAGSLRIGKEQLIALENGDEELLPEEVFIKAMIRRIAERLQLEPKVLMDEFQKDTNLVINSEDVQIEKTKSSKIFSQIPRWAFFSGLIALITSGMAIKSIKDIRNQENKSYLESPELISQKKQALKSGYHIVAPGQTLFMISKFHNIPLEKLVKINNLNNPNKLKVGTILTLKSPKKGKVKSGISNKNQ